MRNLLQANGYPNDSSHMVVLKDDTNDHNYMPNGKNIMKALQWLVQGVGRGDSLFFHFSGHGAQLPDKTGMEKDGLNETILPTDYKNGQITDDELWGSLVRPLPDGARLMAVMDCCHSGTGLDLPFEYIKRKKDQYGGGHWREDENPAHSTGDVVMFSGCQDDQTSADVGGGGMFSSQRAGGAMTNTFLKALRSNPNPTYVQFMGELHKVLKKGGFSQKPMLTSSQRFNLDQRRFSLTQDIFPNTNQMLGRDKRTHFKPASQMNQDLNGLLGLFSGIDKGKLAAGAALLSMLR